jgi:hypothetical protein
MKLVAVVVLAGCSYHGGPTIGYRPATGKVAVGAHGGAGFFVVEAVAGATFSDGASSYLGVRGLLPLSDRSCGAEAECITGITAALGVAGAPRGTGVFASGGGTAWINSDRSSSGTTTTFEIMLEARWIGRHAEITLSPQIGRIEDSD